MNSRFDPIRSGVAEKTSIAAATKPNESEIVEVETSLPVSADLEPQVRNVVQPLDTLQA